MATVASNRTLCDICKKSRGISKCEGCDRIFCYNHFTDHRQQLNQDMDEIEVCHDLCRQTLAEQKNDHSLHSLMEQIYEWERNAIRKVQIAADQAREMLQNQTVKYFTNIESQLNEITRQLKQSREDNDFVETDLVNWKEKLNQLTQDISKSIDVSLREDSKPIVNSIKCIISKSQVIIDAKTKWIQNAVTVAGNNTRGNELDQLSYPWGLYIDDDQTLYITDTNNNRLVQWQHNATRGEVLIDDDTNDCSFTAPLKRPRDIIYDKKTDSFIVSDTENQRIVQFPRQNRQNGRVLISDVCCHGIAMDNNGYLYVADSSRHEVRRWKIGDSVGTLVAGGNSKGNGFDQLDGPMYIFVYDEYSVNVSHQNNHRIMKLAKNVREGMMIAGGQGKGKNLSQLVSPRGIVVDQAENVYVADYGNDRIVRWCKDARLGEVVAGGNGRGDSANQLDGPQDICFDRQGNLYVADLCNHRIQRFYISSV